MEHKASVVDGEKETLAVAATKAVICCYKCKNMKETDFNEDFLTKILRRLMPDKTTVITISLVIAGLAIALQTNHQRSVVCEIPPSRLEVVETIPENLTFGDASLPRSTFDAWSTLISAATDQLDIAAYKSSLRGKHIFGDGHRIASTALGESIFAQLVEAGSRAVRLRIVENAPAKDPGDNADAAALARRRVADSRPLHYGRVFGGGTMHSKFLVADRRHFYMGSANLDWRSLNQKMELGVLVQNCPCLAEDIGDIFSNYWDLAQKQEGATRSQTVVREGSSAQYNKENPLRIAHDGTETLAYLAASPRELNGEGRTWDLDAILEAIENAKDYCYIHVMDYQPMHVYSQPQQYWPVIDDAIRRAVIDRGVEVKLLAAALHFVPQTLRFLRSLASLNSVNAQGSLQVRIFKVPAITEEHQQFARDRRTHNKFMVTESTVIIGTSNWSGDYFFGNTGVALVVHQDNKDRQPFVQQLKDIFVRDWLSDYAHPLSTYIDLCLYGSDPSFCDDEKHYARE